MLPPLANTRKVSEAKMSTPGHATDGLAGASAGRELVILSDLHIGRGKNPDSGRYFALEAFFYDDDLLRFCRYLVDDAHARQVKLAIVLNGDVFDLLRIEPEASTRGSPLERHYGAPNTPRVAARMVRQILAGHPTFAQALALLLAAGHHVIILPGNHDLETQWEPVQAEVRTAVRAALEANTLSHEAADEALFGLRFHSWFYYEPGRIWIEHGCQYDPENAFRYPLRTRLGDNLDVACQHDVPLGNFFQRYLYNAFGHITFIVPSSRANLRYLKWLLLNEPRLLLTVLASHLPFAAQVLRRLAKAAAPGRSELRRRHEASLAQLARNTGLGDTLFAIDRCKEVKADALQATRIIGWQIVKMGGLAIMVALFSVALWFLGFLSINELRAGFGLKALLFLALNFLMLAAAVGSVTYALLRHEAVPSKVYQRAAQRIVDILDVPLVTFGHTHDEVVSRLTSPSRGRAWYYNTGTWVAVFTHDVLLPRERVQYTFLRVQGTQPDLLHWSPGRGEPLQVILLDDSVIDGFGRLPAASPQELPIREDEHEGEALEAEKAS